MPNATPPTTAEPDSDVGKTHAQQHTGNHDRPAKEKAGNETLGGTRAGAENVEPKGKAG